MNENICFTLKTSDINLTDAQATYWNQTVTTSTGIIFNNRTGYTWNNVNLKNLLGNEWYNKYDTFNICLVSLSQSYQSTQPVLSSSNVLTVKMSGLQWLSSYNQATGNSTGETVVALRNFNEYNLTKNNYITFSKGSQITNITINLHSLASDAPLTPTASHVFGHMTFLFNITPVIPSK